MFWKEVSRQEVNNPVNLDFILLYASSFITLFMPVFEKKALQGDLGIIQNYLLPQQNEERR